MYNNQTPNNMWGSKVLKVTVTKFPASDSLDTANLSQSNYTIKVPLSRLLQELQTLRMNGGKVVNVEPFVS